MARATTAVSILMLVGFCWTSAVRAETAAPELAQRRATEIGIGPGVMLDSSTAHLARGLLPPEILRHYETGEYRNEIADWPEGTGATTEEFEGQTRRNGELLDLDENGTIVARPDRRQPPFIYGTPFPTIDPHDPQAAAKILWNHFYNFWWNGSRRNQAELIWVSPRGVDRRAGQDIFFKYYEGIPPAFREANPLNLSIQVIAATTRPADIYGTTALTWRYRDPSKRDSVWAYVPAMRRVRAVSPSNRSDGFLGSDMSQDDGPFFDGKPEDFTWKLTGEAEVLRAVDPYRLSGDAQTIMLPGGGYHAVFPRAKNFGFDDPSWNGLAWAPVIVKLTRRKAWIIEGVPKDRYYLYGKIQLWIDQENWQGAYNRKFGWSGELLNTYLVVGGPARLSPDGRYAFSAGAGGGIGVRLAENVKMNRATAVMTVPGDGVPNDQHVRLEPQLFDYQSLYRFGK